MEMMNRAIEDASEFREMMRKLQEPAKRGVRIAHPAEVLPAIRAVPPKPPKRRGENRAQYRARIHAQAS